MWRCKSQCVWLTVVLMAATVPGCRNGGDPDEAERPPVQETPGTTSPGTEVPVAQKTPKEPPPPPTIPEVLLLDADRQTCVLWVGDVMPEAELADLSGDAQSFRRLFGQRLTVVFFWTSGSSELSAMAARNALEDLQKDVFEAYRDKGVQVIGVNEGDTPEAIGQLVQEAGVMFPNLLDADGALFARVATEKLPRPYLLDAGGKILWFDLEFSRTTRDNLMQGIQVALGEPVE